MLVLYIMAEPMENKSTILDFCTSSNVDCSNNIITNKNEKFESKLNDIYSSLSSMKQFITQLTNKVKDLEKTYRKEQKATIKDKEKRNKGNKQPSGFAKPTQVSDELCDFMNREKGSLIARTDVTKYIIQYIKDKNLEDTQKKSKILPNESLKHLLGVKENEEVTYFNLQRLINPHFTY